jgi:ribonuclease Y
MEFFIGAIFAVLAAGIAGGGVYYYMNSKKVVVVDNKLSEEEAIRLASEKASKRLADAEIEAMELRARTEEFAKKTRKDITEQEEMMVEREKSFNQRAKMLDQKNIELENNRVELKKSYEDLEKKRSEVKGELERISGLSREEAKNLLVKEIEDDLKDFKARRIVEAEKFANEEADEKAKTILIEAMQKVATDYVGETTTTVIKIEDEKIKGRVIGKDGRNIRSFEKATGVDLIMDESQTEIGLSSFDPLRREIARLALSKLIGDGRIHPGTIEEEVRKAKNEIAAEIRKNGQILAEEANWPGIDPELLKLIGKMKYRTSYGQSLMQHSIEVIRIGAAIAAEMGADIDLVKKACLLHDVGKVLTHKVEGAHHHISGQIGRKFGLSEKLVNAIEAHHFDIKPESIEALVVYLADAISGARPGARKDNYEGYIKRVEGIENAAREVGGDKIDEVYAIHAGREVRVIVKSNLTDDNEIVIMSKEIADKIRKTQTYPGTIQVTVIRETRAIEMAS